MRNVLTLVSLCCLLAITKAVNSQSVDAPSRLTIDLQPARLTVDGVISSPAHDNILRNTAARLFDDRVVEFSVTIQVALPPGWALVTDLTLQAMAATRSSAAVINRSGIWVRGFAGDNDHWTNAVARIESALPEGWTLRYRVEEIAASASMHRQCIELFRTATRSRPSSRRRHRRGPRATPSASSRSSSCATSSRRAAARPARRAKKKTTSSPPSWRSSTTDPPSRPPIPPE